MRPVETRLLRQAREFRWYILVLVLVAILSVTTTAGIAWFLASFVNETFVNKAPTLENVELLVIAVTLATFRACLHFAHEYIAARVSFNLKNSLREKVLDHVDRGASAAGTGGWSMLLTRGLDSLDLYFAKFIPQLVFASIVTPVFVIFLLVVDPTSALILVFTLPVIPLFMALIGYATRDLQQTQLHGMERMNNHFNEVVRGVLTLRAFGRANHQESVLEEISEDHRKRTIKVLRVSFLSGFALELAASLSVALIAVTIGIRLISGDMTLLIGLFVLLLAPEAYLPLRQVGTLFHASSEAVAVTQRVFDFLEEPAPSKVKPLQLSEASFIVLVGPSGSGKSLALKSLSGMAAWMPQQSRLLQGTVLTNITMFKELDPAVLRRVRELAAIEHIPLELIVGLRNTLSGGEQQRVALARTLYFAFVSDRRLIALDEPLSQQSPELVDRISAAIKELSAEGYQVAIASHQPTVIGLADEVITFA